MSRFDSVLNKIRSDISEIKKEPKSFTLNTLFESLVFGYFFGSFYFLVYAFYSVINPLIVLFFVIILLGLFLLYKHEKFETLLIKMRSPVIVGLVIIWITSQLLVVGSIEVGYYETIDEYSQEYLMLKENDVNDINTTWSLANTYYKDMTKTYDQDEIRVPSRVLSTSSGSISTFLFNPVFYLYLVGMDDKPNSGFYKLIIVQNAGACGEFSNSMGLLLKDITGFDTRVIAMEGKDHALPEINIDGQWWVFDRTFTTQDYPVESLTYNSFIEESRPNLFTAIHNLREVNENNSLLDEHGFNYSKLTITAVSNVSPSDNDTISDAHVEILAYDNSYDPVVSHGKTDGNGVYIDNLRSEKMYLVIVRDTIFPKPSRIGFSDVYLYENNNSSIVVHLHKYD